MACAARCLLLASLACCVSAAHGNCIPDDGLGNTTCQSPDEHSFVQSWKRTDRAPPGPQPLPAARQLGLMWAPAMWLVLLVPFAAMQFWTGAKPQKSATEALLHGAGLARVGHSAQQILFNFELLVFVLPGAEMEFGSRAGRQLIQTGRQ